MQNDGLVTASNESKSWFRQLPLTAVCQLKLHDFAVIQLYPGFCLAKS